MTLNDDPDALSDEEYWSDLEKTAAEHPMLGPPKDEYEVEDDD